MWISFRNGALNQGCTYDVSFITSEDTSGDEAKDNGCPLSTYVGGIIWGTCVIDGSDNIYVGSSSGKFFKIDSTGKIVWKYNLVSKTDSLVDSAAAIHRDGFVVVPGGDGYLHALDMETGSVIWRLKAPHNIDDKIDRSGVVVNSFEGNVQVNPFNGWIYAGNDNTRFYCIRPDGTEVWSIKTDMMIWSCAAFCFGGRGVVFGCLDHHIYLVDAVTGRLIAKKSVGAEIKSSPVVVQLMDGTELVYICNSNGFVKCFMLGENMDLVSDMDVGNEIYSSPAFKNGLLVVCTFDGRVICFDCSGARKKIIWEHNFHSHICCSPIITADNIVIFGDSKGLLYAIQLENGQIVACYQTSKHIFKRNLNASPAMDSKGIVHIGSYDGHIHHVNFEKCYKDPFDPVPRFIRQGRTHLELDYDGVFVKQYRVRVFDDNGRYIPDAAIDVSTVKHMAAAGCQILPSSNGKYINVIHALGQHIDCHVSSKFYIQTNSWFKDRFSKTLPLSVSQRITHKFPSVVKGLFENKKMLAWDVYDLSVIQPQILDTYIPAALDSVNYKIFMFDIRSNGTLAFVMIPAVKNHNDDSLMVIPEPQKILLLEGQYHGNCLYLKSQDGFEFSSMGGTIKFKDFNTLLHVNPTDMTFKGEFLTSSSCLKIKGNDSSYKFSSEIVNQLCDPYMYLHGLGIVNGRPTPIKRNQNWVTIQVIRSGFLGLKTSIDVVFAPVGAGVVDKKEVMGIVIYNTTSNPRFSKKWIVSTFEKEEIINIPSNIRSAYAFINDVVVGYWLHGI